MLCPLCGADVGEKISLCDSCKAKQEAERAEREKAEADLAAEQGGGKSHTTRMRRKKAGDNEGETEGESMVIADFSPAGFWWRAFAYFFDLFVLLIVYKAACTAMNISTAEMAKMIGGGMAAITLSLMAAASALGLYVGLHFIYFSGFEASALKATPGKLLFGLQVVDGAGAAPSFGAAAMRWIASGFSIATVGIGFLLAAVTEQKRALHDMMSGCYVEMDDEVSTTRRLICSIATVLLVFFVPVNDFRPHQEEDGQTQFYNSANFQNTEGQPAGAGEQPGTVDQKIELGSVPELEPGAPGYLLIDKASIVFRSAVALRNPIDRLLYVGLYENKLSDEQRQKIRETGSINGLEDQQPVAWFKLRFSKDAKSCNLATLEQYTLTIQRGGQIFLKDDLPQIEFNRTGTWKQSGEISKFECAFTDNGKFRGIFNDTSIYQFSDGPLRFTWFLELNTPLIALDEDTAIKIEKARQKKVRGGTDFSFPGTIKINGNETRFASAFALIYPQYGRVEIGLYTDQLTNVDVAQIGAAKFLKQIKTKLPSAVLNLKFKKTAQTASPEALESYNLYLYRDSMAKLTFPGSEDVLGISHEEPAEIKRDVAEISGSIGEGKTVTGVIDSAQIIGDLRVNAEIFLHFKVTPVLGR